MSAVAKYQAAMYALTQCQITAEGVVERLVSAATLLHDWRKVVIANVSGVWPTELGASRHSPKINGNDIPTAQELADALQAWHSARGEARSAFEQIPHERRTGLSVPP